MRRLLILCSVTLAVRLALLSFVRFPGIADPNHYYNLAVRVVEGHGFSADYLWQYNPPPSALEQPEMHWMPMASWIAAASMKVFGVGVTQALLPFVILSALLPALAYAAARRLELSEGASLFSAAAMAALPEMNLYALRTDTVVPASLWIGSSILLLTFGLRTGSRPPLVGSGLAAAAAFLTRSDAFLLLPMLAATLALDAGLNPGDGWRRRRAALLVPAVALAAVAPWLARNLQVSGSAISPEIGSMFFFTDHDDHYAYGRGFTWETLLAGQTALQVVGKRLWELAAAFHVMAQALGGFLSVAVAGGVLLLRMERRSQRWTAVAPAVILLGTLLVVYPILIPYKSQAGSFKKAFVAILPLLVPLGALALERAVSDARLRRAVMVLAVALAGAQALDAFRREIQFVGGYLGEVQTAAAVIRDLPDTNGDSRIVLMAQDPFILRFVGFRSIMFPDEDRDQIVSVAGRYAVDYLLMPAHRDSLDPLLAGDESDERFVFVAEVPPTHFRIYGIQE